MVNERAQAISVANRYFTLVDGMVPGFKDHLAENVTLKWFGKKIIGKEKVAAFILTHKQETFHTFSDIKPTSNITYEKKSNRKKEPSLDQNANKYETHTTNCFREASACCSHEAEKSTTHENIVNFNKKYNVKNAGFVHKRNYGTCNITIRKYIKNLKRSTASNDINVNIDMNRNEINSNVIMKIDKQHYNKNVLYNIYEPEIMSQAIVGKIQNINRIKLREEMAPTIRAINRECGQGDGPVIAEANATKYLKAKGEIKFRQLNTEKDSQFLYYWPRFWKKKVWKRQCKLQIAYSLDNGLSKINNECYTAQKNARSSHSNHPTIVHGNAYKMQESKLPSLEEAIKVSNTLIPDVNYFGGYLKPLNFLEDREKFLKSFEAEMRQKNPNMRSCAHYVNNKLMLDFPSKKPLNATYQIHMIVYTRIGTDEFTA